MGPTRVNQQVVVLDDYFPNLRTGFRVAEFTTHLRTGAVDEVMTTAEPLGALLHEFDAHFHDLTERVRPFSPEALESVDLAYIVFLNNAHYYLPYLTAAAVPFIVTLYPGGGLDLGEPQAEQKLRAVLSSPFLRHVITTQPIVTDHVQDLLGRPSSVPITEIPGLVTSAEYHTPGAGMRNDYFGSGKETLDLVFVAFKYSERGADKGFPQFADLVQALHETGIPVKAHVVGGFTADDLATDHLIELFDFHAPKSTRELRQFYLDKDLIVSPNRAGVLGPGAFDGFPLGSSIEGALSGVAMMASDGLDQNSVFRDGRDILITTPEPASMHDRLLRLFEEPDGLRRIAQSGLRTARAHYSPASQVDRRARIIAAALQSDGFEAHGLAG